MYIDATMFDIVTQPDELDRDLYELILILLQTPIPLLPFPFSLVFFFESLLYEYNCNICSCMNTRTSHTTRALRDLQLHLDKKSRPSEDHWDQTWLRRRRARRTPCVAPRKICCRHLFMGHSPGAKTRAEQRSNAGGGRSTEWATPNELRQVFSYEAKKNRPIALLSSFSILIVCLPLFF
jgi:hypothetical protein